MNFDRPRLDDSFHVAAVAVAAAFAIGLSIAVWSGDVLDRGSAQARADLRERAVGVAAAGKEAGPVDLKVAARAP